MNKIVLLFVLLTGICITGCISEKGNSRNNLAFCDISFFGDSAALFVANNLQNGYQISIIHNKQIDLMHFERGDSINQYCAIHKLPYDIMCYEEDSIGIFYVDLDFPVIKVDTIGGSKNVPDMFFMDVNFDGEEDFIVAHEGYNRTYYACFDLAKGNRRSACPGMLESIQDEPYNNIVSGIYEQPSYTVFNKKKKEIYIYETMGCCSYYETWAKYYEGDNYGTEAKVITVKKEDHEWWADGKEHIATYELINDSLKLVEKKVLD